MKQLTCELCGSADFTKQDGFFVCQACGMKYSTDEARKMMGAPVEPSGAPVRTAASKQCENLLTLARSSFDSENYAQAEGFCNQILSQDNE